MKNIYDEEINENLLTDEEKIWNNAIQTIINDLEKCVCNKNPSTLDGPSQDCPEHGDDYSQYFIKKNILTARKKLIDKTHQPRRASNQPSTDIISF